MEQNILEIRSLMFSSQQTRTVRTMRDSVRIAIKRISCVFLTILLNSLFLLMGLNRDFNPFLDGNVPWIPELLKIILFFLISIFILGYSMWLAISD